MLLMLLVGGVCDTTVAAGPRSVVVRFFVVVCELLF